MKRVLVLSILSVLLLSGCGGKSGKLECTKTTTDDENLQTIETIKVSYKDDHVTKVENTIKTEVDPSLLEFSYNIYDTLIASFNDINGFEASLSKENDNIIVTNFIVDYKTLDVNKLKEVFGNDTSEGVIYNTDLKVTIDDFIESDLNGYTCK